MRLILAVVMLLAVAVCGTANAIDITACGQVVPDGEIGVLMQDLACSGPGVCLQDFTTPCHVGFQCPGSCDAAAVTLGRRSTLNMNGHAIVSSGSDPRQGIFCIGTKAPCTVIGPGDISGGLGIGIVASSRLLTVSQVTIHDIAVDPN